MRWIGNATTFAAGGLIIVAIIFECKLNYDRVCVHSDLDLVFIAKAMWNHRTQTRSLQTRGWDKL